ncbi:MAG: flagellar hook-associated protein FlgK [Alphaproteobacteria bacterium]|nr:flagellar hook-associated protein FlgK [Alphaproteobacteria bacterium]
MSLNSILSTAVSGLLTNQTALRTTSNNIANVDTDGYNRRDVQFGPRLTGSTLTGVQIDEIRRIANQYLDQESLSATSAFSKADTLSSYFSRVQQLVASLTGDSSLQARIQTAMTALSQLSTNPSSAATRASALSAVQTALSSISSMADGVQSLRQDANTQLTDSISTVNDLISRIYDLNTQIKRAYQNGDTSTGLLDDRDKAIAQLSEQIDVRTFEQPDGRVFVSMGDGTSLISDLKSELRYNSPTTVTSATSFPSIMLQQMNANGVDMGPPTAIEGRVRGGTFRGLLDLRDKTLPDLAEQLGALAGGLAEQLNAIHNDSSSVPPPATLTGRNTGLLSSDALNMSGVATIAIVDAQGQLVQKLDLDFSTLATVGDVVSAINSGLGGAATATFSNGVLSITANNSGQGIAIKQDDTDPSSRAGRGFSQVFGLNDLIQASSPSSFATGMASGDAHGFTAGDQASFVLRGTDGAILKTFSITIGGTTVGDIVSDLNTAAAGAATFTLGSDGTLTMTPATPGARLEVTDDTTSRGTTGVSLSQFFGLGTAVRADQAAGLTVRSDIASNGQLLALAQLEVGPTTAAGDVVLGAGDNRGALGLAAVANASFTWPAAGGFGSTTMSLSDFTARIIGTQSDLASSAEADQAYRSDVKQEVAAKKTSVEGVNLDDELSNMMLFQKAYNASARMLTTVQQMYDTLLQAV